MYHVDMKINKDRLLSKGIYCTKFGNFQAWDQIWNGKQLYRGQ